MMNDGADLADAEMLETVARVRPELRRILFAHRIPGEDCPDVVRRALVDTAVHWEGIADKAQWLLAAVQFECLAYWQERGQPSPALHKPQPPRPVREVLADGGLSVDMDVLRAMVPARRRRVLFAPGGAVAQLRLVLAQDRGEPAGGLAQ